MIHLDTHVTTALYEGELDRLSRDARRLIDRDPNIRISPMVFLELDLLHEIRRLRMSAANIVQKLSQEFGLQICDRSFIDVTRQAASETWTRDPFDRMIVAQARLANAALITRDERMHVRYAKALG